MRSGFAKMDNIQLPNHGVIYNSIEQFD